MAIVKVVQFPVQVSKYHIRMCTQEFVSLNIFHCDICFILIHCELHWPIYSWGIGHKTGRSLLTHCHVGQNHWYLFHWFTVWCLFYPFKRKQISRQTILRIKKRTKHYCFIAWIINVMLLILWYLSTFASSIRITSNGSMIF